MHTADRTPSMPAASAIISDAEPTQWPSACTLPAPVTRRTSATASGQSCRAMSSSVNAVRPRAGRCWPGSRTARRRSPARPGARSGWSRRCRRGTTSPTCRSRRPAAPGPAAALVADEAQPAGAVGVGRLVPVALVPASVAVAPARLGGGSRSLRRPAPVSGMRRGGASGNATTSSRLRVDVGQRAEEPRAEAAPATGGARPSPSTPVTCSVVSWRAKSAGAMRMTPAATGVARLVADRDVQRGRVAPQVEPEAVVQELVALEAEPAAVVGHQHHRVAHVPGVDVGRVLLRQAEAPVLHPQPPGRQRRGGRRCRSGARGWRGPRAGPAGRRCRR